MDLIRIGKKIGLGMLVVFIANLLFVTSTHFFLPPVLGGIIIVGTYIVSGAFIK